MLDIRFIRENPEVIEEALKNRHAKWDYDEFRRLDAERREIIQKVESLKAERNAVSKQIGAMLKEGNAEEAENAKIRMRDVGDEINNLDGALVAIEEELNGLTYSIPNIPGPNTPVGDDEDDNPEVRRWGTPREFDFEAKAHWDLGPELGIIDFERGVKLAHARFYALHGAGARLERSLINFMLNEHVKWGSTEWWVPALANKETLTGTGQLPKFEEDAFALKNTDYFLIPTAEVPVTNLHRDEILSEDALPIKYCAYTACFRAEAGSAGRDTRGLIRQHQFDKVELVKFTRPSESYEELEKLTADAESVLRRLKLPYRVMALSTGDIGFSSAKTYDLEVWMPSYGRYVEISSCSNFEDYQARRGNIRFRREATGKPEFVHTLNGSGLATSRIFPAMVEQNQRADGSVVVPEVLRKYLGGIEVIEKK